MKKTLRAQVRHAVHMLSPHLAATANAWNVHKLVRWDLADKGLMVLRTRAGIRAAHACTPPAVVDAVHRIIEHGVRQEIERAFRRPVNQTLHGGAVDG